MTESPQEKKSQQSRNHRKGENPCVNFLRGGIVYPIPCASDFVVRHLRGKFPVTQKTSSLTELRHLVPSRVEQFF